MDLDTLIGDLDLANGATGAPIRLYNENVCVWRCSTSETLELGAEYDRPLIDESRSSGEAKTLIRLTDYGEMWAMIKFGDGELTVIVGPAAERILSDEAIRQVEKPSERNRLGAFLKIRDRLPRMQWTRFVSAVSVIYRLATERRLDPSDIVTRMRSPLESEIFEAMDRDLSRAGERSAMHDTARFERILIELVREGEVQKVVQHLGTAAGEIGIVSPNPIRQDKDMFIVSTAIVARAAIEGGLHSEIALSLSDAYIARCEELKSIAAIKQLFPSMILDYARRVADAKLKSPLSPVMRKVVDYIYLHISEEIDAKELAAKFGYSRSYFSRMFMGEVKMSIPAYVARERVSKAKDLLVHTDSTIADIAGLVGIVTPSRFISLFKKETGQTPLQYRLSAQTEGAAAHPRA
jgi:AraC-type DNA-binding domain-containing proteins